MTACEVKQYTQPAPIIEGVEHRQSTPLYIAEPEDPRATPELFNWKFTHVNTALRGIEIDGRSYPPSEELDQHTVWKLQRVLYHMRRMAQDTSLFYDIDRVTASIEPIDSMWFTLEAIKKNNSIKSRFNNPHHYTINVLTDHIQTERRGFVHCPVHLLSDIQANGSPEQVEKAYGRPLVCGASFCTANRMAPPSFELKEDGIVHGLKNNTHGCYMPLADAMKTSTAED